MEDADKRGMELYDCRLCQNYIDAGGNDIALRCSLGYFDYFEKGGAVEGATPNFQCDGSRFRFNPDSESAQALLNGAVIERKEGRQTAAFYRSYSHFRSDSEYPDGDGPYERPDGH